MGFWRKIVSVLLVAVVLSSIVSPALAVSTTDINKPNTSSCATCSLERNVNVSIVEVKGLEKNKLIAKALKNEDVKKLLNMLTKKGYKLKLSDAKVIKAMSDRGFATTILVPLTTTNKKLAKASVIYAITPGGISVGAIEMLDKNKIKQITLYYVDVNGEIGKYTIQGTTECWNCIWTCTADCIIEQCAPYTPGICSFCYPLLECCLAVPGPENPCCEGALICYGAIATGCFCWCTYYCNQIGECP